MDDEYKWAGVEDPKIMITTSRDPSSRLKMFAKVSGWMGDEMLPVNSQKSSQDVHEVLVRTLTTVVTNA